jgi:hypothetical protein
MSKVYVVNRSSHDFKEARRYGELLYLSDGPMNRYSTNSMMRCFGEVMKNSLPEDYIVLCSLNVMNSIACALFAFKHGTLNLLLFKDGNYIERNHVFNERK